MDKQYCYHPGTPYQEANTGHIVRIACLSIQDAWNKTQYFLKELVSYETITGLFITCTRDEFEDVVGVLEVDAAGNLTPSVQPRFTEITEEEFIRLWEESKK